MDRRNFLISSSAVALGIGTAAAAAASAAKAADDAQALASPAIMPTRRALRMVSLWPDAVTGPGDHVRRFARRVEAATDGRWAIEIADETVAGADAFKAVMTGDADLYVGHEHAHRELHPAFSYFAGLPCGTGMHVDQFNVWLVAAGGQELWDDLAAEFNTKSLVIGHSGNTWGLFARQPIRTRADVHRRRIAVDGLAAEVLKAVDAEPVEGLLDPLSALLSEPSLDGVEVYGPAFHTISRETRLRLDRGTQTALFPGLNDTGYAITLGVRRGLWDGFAQSERVVLSAVAAEALAEGRAEITTLSRAFDHMTQPAEISGNDWSRPHWQAIATELARIAETIVADLAGHDEPTRRINASYMAFKGLGKSAPSA